MKKYNLSAIMKEAWNLYRMAQRWVNGLNFSECLRRAWAKAKKEAEKIAKSANLIGMQHIVVDGAFIDVNIYNGNVTGNTYRCRRTLKEYGAQWNPYENVWEMSLADAKALCIAHM